MTALVEVMWCIMAFFLVLCTQELGAVVQWLVAGACTLAQPKGIAAENLQGLHARPRERRQPASQLLFVHASTSWWPQGLCLRRRDASL
jgi:hypothetical protein